MASLTLDQKKKVYWNIFYVLTALTVFELSIVFAPLPQIGIDLLVIIASVSKACAVGWVYMHLNHEAKGLKILLLAPLFVAFFYAAFLITDSKFSQSRHTSPYVGQPKRFFGQRNLVERVVDDFGNTVVQEQKPMHVEGHEGGEKAEAHGEATAETKAVEKTEASSSSSEEAKH